MRKSQKRLDATISAEKPHITRIFQRNHLSVWEAGGRAKPSFDKDAIWTSLHLKFSQIVLVQLSGTNLFLCGVTSFWTGTKDCKTSSKAFKCSQALHQCLLKPAKKQHLRQWPSDWRCVTPFIDRYTPRPTNNGVLLLFRDLSPHWYRSLCRPAMAAIFDHQQALSLPRQCYLSSLYASRIVCWDFIQSEYENRSTANDNDR